MWFWPLSVDFFFWLLGPALLCTDEHIMCNICADGPHTDLVAGLLRERMLGVDELSVRSYPWSLLRQQREQKRPLRSILHGRFTTPCLTTSCLVTVDPLRWTSLAASLIMFSGTHGGLTSLRW